MAEMEMNLRKPCLSDRLVDLSLSRLLLSPNSHRQIPTSSKTHPLILFLSIAQHYPVLSEPYRLGRSRKESPDSRRAGPMLQADTCQKGRLLDGYLIPFYHPGAWFMSHFNSERQDVWKRGIPTPPDIDHTHFRRESGRPIPKSDLLNSTFGIRKHPVVRNRSDTP